MLALFPSRKRTHTRTHTQAQTNLHTEWESRQAKSTRSRRQTRKKSNMHTSRSKTTCLTWGKQDAWCEYGKCRAQRTQLLSQGSLKNSPIHPKVVPNIMQKHPWRPPKRQRALEQCPRLKITKFGWPALPSCMPKAFQIRLQNTPRQPKIKIL